MGARLKNTVTDEQAQTALSRSGFYRLFGRLFRREIDNELLTALHSPALQETLQTLGLQLPLEADKHEQLQILAEEYTRLFIVPGEHLAPYASVQKTPDGLLNGVETAALRRFIKGTGFKFNELFKDYPDHISAEFEYMETLVQREYEAWLAGDTEEHERSQIIQQNLFEDFINTWVPSYCERLRDKARHPFYQQLAVSTSQFIALEQNLFMPD